MLKTSFFPKIRKIAQRVDKIRTQEERVQLILDLKVLHELAYQAAQIPKGGSLLFRKSTGGC